MIIHHQKEHQHVLYLALALFVVTGGLVFQVHERVVYCGSKAVPAVCWLRFVFRQGCPGCGLTRSVVAFFHLQWEQSLVFHPAGWLVACASLFQLPYRTFCLCGKASDGFKGYMNRAGRIFWIAVLCMSVFWWLFKFLK